MWEDLFRIARNYHNHLQGKFEELFARVQEVNLYFISCSWAGKKW